MFHFCTLATLAECLVFLLLLAVAKSYFVKIFTKYYKYLMWQEQHANELRAQYVNGRYAHFAQILLEKRNSSPLQGRVHPEVVLFMWIVEREN